MPSRRSDEAGPQARPQAFRYAGLGVQFSAVIGVFAWAGWWVDGKLGSAPWLLIVGVFLGFLGGLISLVHKIPSSTKKSSATERSSDQSS